MGRPRIYTPEEAHVKNLESHKRYRIKNRECLSEYGRVYYKKNKHKIDKEAAKVIRKRTYKRNRLDEIEKAKTYRSAHIERTRYIEIKSGAKKRHIEFNLTFEQFMIYWAKSCTYCGDKIETIGIDRVNNNRGYTQTNLVTCCYTCNWMKRHLNYTDFINHCDKILKIAKILKNK